MHRPHTACILCTYVQLYVLYMNILNGPAHQRLTAMMFIYPVVPTAVARMLVHQRIHSSCQRAAWPVQSPAVLWSEIRHYLLYLGTPKEPQAIVALNDTLHCEAISTN